MTDYLPEGSKLETPENRAALRSASSLEEAFFRGLILEARAMVCDGAHNLFLDLGPMHGVIPHDEGATGIATGCVRDIALISRVNKPVCFRIVGFERDMGGTVRAVCSRRAVQESCQADYIAKLSPGDVIPAVVTHLEPFGCFADVGCGIISLLPIDAISISRISHPADRFCVGQSIRVVVRSRDELGRLCLSHKELLGTWDENAAFFSPGETVAGIIRSVEEYGVFVELSPNLAGLAEPCQKLRSGQHASVFIKNLIPEKMKVKLIIIDAFDASYSCDSPHYFIDSGHIDRWRYSPASCPKLIESVFGE